MIEDPNPTPIPGSLNFATVQSGDACGEACGEAAPTLEQQIAACVDLAKHLFEAEYTLHGGRKAGDPSWEECEDEHDDWMGEANRAWLVFGPELDRLRTELHDHIDAAVRSGERLMDTQTERDELRWLHAEAVWQRDEARQDAVDADCFQQRDHAAAVWVWQRVDRYRRERDEARAEVVRLSSGDTPLSPASKPPQSQDVLREAFEGAARMMATNVRDWGLDRCDAWLWGLLCGWDGIEGDSSAMREVAEQHGWSNDEVARLRRYRAAIAGLFRAPAPTSSDVWIDVLDHAEVILGEAIADDLDEYRFTPFVFKGDLPAIIRGYLAANGLRAPAPQAGGTWCNCQAIPSTDSYPGPWHERGGEPHYRCAASPAPSPADEPTEEN